MAGSGLAQSAGNAGVRPAASGVEPATGLPPQSSEVSWQPLGDKRGPAPRAGSARGLRAVGERPTRARVLLDLTQERKSADSAEGYFELNAKLAESLRLVGRVDLAERVEQCHRSFSGYRCENGHTWARPDASCQVRLCAFDMRARAMRAVHRFEKPLSDLADPRYVVLTTQNVPLSRLGEGITHLWESFGRLRHMTAWREVRAAVAIFETTLNAKTREWHPHLNVIFDGEYIPKRELTRAWERATRGRGKITWITRVWSPVEVFKYVTKLMDLVALPEAVDEFLRATRKVRFIRTYGTLYNLCLEDEDHPLACPDCQTTQIEKLGYVPASAVFVDGQGVLRFDVAFAAEMVERQKWRRLAEESEPVWVPWEQQRPEEFVPPPEAMGQVPVNFSNGA